MARVDIRLPYAPGEQCAVRVLAAVPRAHRCAESLEWIAGADLTRHDDGSWSIRVRELFHGNRWCGWRHIRRPVRMEMGEGWTMESFAAARKALRADCELKRDGQL